MAQRCGLQNRHSRVRIPPASPVTESYLGMGASELLHLRRDSNRGREVFCFEQSEKLDLVTESRPRLQ